MQKCPSCGTQVEAAATSCRSCGGSLNASLVPTSGPEADAGPASSQSRDDLLIPGKVLADRYRIIEFLGRGGMGQVVRAKDQALDQIVALKFLPPNLARDPDAINRVRSEVRMARRVSHPNVCRVHDLGAVDSLTFISMEYIDGEDLASLLRRVGRLAGDRGLEIAREFCAGLAAAHASGVIHRDLKPANVMLDRNGRVRIADFGIALLEEGASAEIAGTPAYMAPEQLAGTGATFKSDLYSLGLVLYEIFTGKRVYTGGALSDVLRQRRETNIIPPTQYVPEIDPVVEAIILKCLAQRPDARPESALEVLSALSGGDQLKAALAAGQTPSPSAVAAAPVRGALKPLMAWLCFASMLAGMVCGFSNVSPFTVLGRMQPRLPPVVLAVKAEEAMRALGYSADCFDDASGFIYSDDALRMVVNPKADFNQRAAAERRMIVFWHRCSPNRLMPLDPAGKVTLADPPFGSGEALLLLDLDGRLLEYRGMKGAETGEVKPGNLTEFFRLAAANASLPGDGLVADGDIKVDVVLDSTTSAKVEGNILMGRLTEARIVFPWTSSEKPQTPKVFNATDVPDLFIILIIVVSIPLAVRNLKGGRGDRQGSWRLGLLVFGCFFGATLVSAHHVGTLNGEMILLVEAVSRSLWRSVTAILLYLALEPLVRKVWPESLVSWTRMLSGNLRDPLVARDVLLGVTTFWVLTGVWVVGLTLSGSDQLIPIKRNLDSLLGWDQCAAITAQSIVLSLRLGLIFLLVLLFVRLLSRIRWVGQLVLFVIFAIFCTAALASVRGISPSIVIASVIFSFAFVFLLTRFGLLATTVIIFFGAIGLSFPDASALTGWTAFLVWWHISLALLFSIYGLYFATGRRLFGERRLLDTS